MRLFQAQAAAFVATLATALTCAMPAAQAATVSLTSSASTVAVGDVFTVRLGIADLSAASGNSLSGFDIALAFDSSAVSWLGFSFDDGASGQNQLDWPEAGGFGFLGDAFGGGPGSIVAFGLSGNSAAELDAQQADAFDFLTLSFQALAPTASALFSLDTSDPALLFVDSDAARLGVSFGSTVATVAIGGGSTGVPEPGSAWLVLGALGLLAARRQAARRVLGAGAAGVAALALAGPALAAEPARTAPQVAPVAGTVVQVQGQRMKIKAANGSERWATTGTPLTPQHVGKRVRGDGRAVGDTVLIAKPVFE
jgi:hypothetical protein